MIYDARDDVVRVWLRAHGIHEESVTQRDLTDAETRMKYRWLRHGGIRARGLVEDWRLRKLRDELGNGATRNQSSPP